MTTLKRILLVDADADDQLLFKEALNTLHHSIYCKTVQGGQEAIKHLDAFQNYEMIFLHLNTSSGNALQLLQIMKNTDSLRSIPIIVYASSRSEKSLADLKDLDIYQFLNKPYNFSELCSGLDTIFESSN